MGTFHILVVLIVSFRLAGSASPLLEGNYNRILGGRDVISLKYPFMVALESANNEQFCVGTAISKHWFVTAAHCFRQHGAVDIQVRSGTVVRGTGGTLHGVARVVVHPGYLSSPHPAFHHNIALARVSEEFTIKSHFHAFALLPHLNEVVKTGARLTAVGWGMTGQWPNQKPSIMLQETQLKVISRRECNDSLSRGPARQHWGPRKVWVGSEELCTSTQGKDFTLGDDGGPLLRVQKDSSVLVGVMVWSLGQGDSESPGVHVNVAAYTHWIRRYAGTEQL